MARSFLAISVIAAVALPALSSAGAKEAMAFAADMAGRGNWREARYRWEQILAEAIARGGDRALAGYHVTRDELALPLFEVTDRIASFEWSLAELEELHLRLSDAMKREVAEMAARRLSL